MKVNQWKELLNNVKPDNGSTEDDLLEQIKTGLEKEDKGTYLEWQQKGFDIDHQFEGSTLLNLAARVGNLDIVKYLIEKGADVNVEDKTGRTALHLAVKNGRLDMVEFLIGKGDDVNIADKDGKTALHLAAYYGHLDIVKFLIEKGADINKVDELGDTALCLAVEYGHLDIVKFLASKENVDIDKAEGKTALHYAALNGFLDIVKFLIEKGADINKVDNVAYEHTALHLAALGSSRSVVEVVKVLLDRGADTKIQDRHGKVPLDYAIEKGNKGAAELLIRHEVKLDPSNANYGLADEERVGNGRFFAL